MKGTLNACDALKDLAEALRNISTGRTTRQTCVPLEGRPLLYETRCPPHFFGGTGLWGCSRLSRLDWAAAGSSAAGLSAAGLSAGVGVVVEAAASSPSLAAPWPTFPPGRQPHAQPTLQLGDCLGSRPSVMLCAWNMVQGFSVGD